MNSPENSDQNIDIDILPNFSGATRLGEIVEFIQGNISDHYLNYHDYLSNKAYWFPINRIACIENRILIDTNGPDENPLVIEFNDNSSFVCGIFEDNDLWFQDKEWNKSHSELRGSYVWWGITSSHE